MQRAELRPIRREKNARPRRRRKGTLLASVLFVAFMVVVLFAAPKILPPFFQRLVGLVCALLAAVVAMTAVREFGNKWNTVRVPKLGELSTSSAAGIAAFAVVAAWWLSPAAPILPGHEPVDIAALVNADLQVPLLTLADPALAAIQTPALCNAAYVGAKFQEPSAAPLDKLYAQLSLGQMKEADELLAAQASNTDETWQRAKAQTAMITGKFPQAAKLYDELTKQKPVGDLVTQGALCHALSENFGKALAAAKSLHANVATGGGEDPQPRALNLTVALAITRARPDEYESVSAEFQPLLARAAENRPQLLAAVMNQGVQSALDSPPNFAHAATQFEWAHDLSLAKNAEEGKPRGNMTPLTATALHNLAVIELAQGRLAAAEQHLVQALNARRELLRADDPQTGLTLKSLADLNLAQGRPVEAEETARMAYDLAARTLHPNSPTVLACEATLAACEAELGYTAKALNSYRRIISATESVLSTAHPFAIACRARLAELYLNDNRMDEAGQIAQQAYTQLKTTGRLNHPDTTVVLRVLALAGHKPGRVTETRKQLKAAQDALDKAYGSASATNWLPETAANRAALGSLTENAASLPGGLVEYQQAIDILQGGGEENAVEHPRIAQYLADMGRLNLKFGNTADAIAALQKSLAMWESLFPVGQNARGHSHPSIARTLDSLAEAQEKAGQSAQAAAAKQKAAAVRAEFARLGAAR